MLFRARLAFRNKQNKKAYKLIKSISNRWIVKSNNTKKLTIYIIIKLQKLQKQLHTTDFYYTKALGTSNNGVFLGLFSVGYIVKRYLLRTI